MPPKKHARTESHDADPNLMHPSPKRAKEIDTNENPYEMLQKELSKSASKSAPRNVLHWFRSQDLRQEDNRALHAASQKAAEGDGKLIAMYLHSPKDLEWHGLAPVRIDFMLEGLKILKAQLEEKNVPLAVVEVEKRSQKTERVMEFVKENDVSHVYANMEYEVDELRRDIKVAERAKKGEVGFEVLHDQTVVTPGLLTTGAGGPMKVFTPYHKAWLEETKSEPSWFDTVPAPEGNDKAAKEDLKKLFDSKVPKLPDSKQFSSDEEKEKLRELWPAGHEAGMKRLRDFLQKKVANYADDRSNPALDPSSRLSPYFATGTISMRETMQTVKKHDNGKHFVSPGPSSWVRELVFREFYRHTLINTPHTSMNLPNNVKFDYVHWEDDPEGEEKWYKGTTGEPFVDAGMRQLNAEAYLHNRLRMNVSSYLRANLLIDYRKGERYFAEHLVDWDLANNTNGWEPSYTIFNPVNQAEKCDPDGDYIRKWVPELKDVKGKAVFAPAARLSKAEFEKLGYPRPHVNYSESAQRAKERYKRDLHSQDD